MTNYEKIKNMSVEEMAKMLLFKKFSCVPFCEECNNCNQYNFKLPHCEEGIKQWLNSEVEMKVDNFDTLKKER